LSKKFCNSKKLSNSPLELTFPNVLVILRIFACIPCTNVNGPFSVLQRLKNYFNSTLTQGKTSLLSLLCIKSEVIRQIDWLELIYKFVLMKVRKKII